MTSRSTFPKYLSSTAQKKVANSKSEFFLGTLCVSKILKPNICDPILDTSHLYGKR